MKPETWSRAIEIARWLRRRAENVAALLLLVMFLCFILQIVARYVFNYPLGWTDEASVLCWIWCTLWGAAFVLREKDEVRFDIFYSTASEKTRCVFTVITGVAAIVLFAIALPAVISYVTFLKVERSAYLGIRLDYLYSIYIVFSVGRHRSLCRADLARHSRPSARHPDRKRVGAMTSPFGLCICAILGLGLLGLPIGYSMIAGSILYLLLAGLDLGTSAEQILNGLYNSYVLLAVPLFLFSAELMNVSKMTDQLLRFCDMLVGRFRGGLGHINIVQSIIFAGMSGSAIADLAATGPHQHRHDDAQQPLPGQLCGRGHRGIGGDRADHPAVDPDGALRADFGCVRRLSVSRRRHSGPSDGARADGRSTPFRRTGTTFRSRSRSRCANGRASPGRDACAADAGHPARRNLRRRHDADRGRRGRRRLCVSRRRASGIATSRCATPIRRCSTARASTASIGMLIAGALVFNYVVTIEQIPETVKGLLAGYDLSPLMFLFWVNVILLVLGCLLEGSTIILVILPIFIPTAKALGIDLVHFGVVAVFNIMIGLITPPYGLLLFIISAISGAPLRTIIRDTMPFVSAMIVALAIITFIPETVLWLPRLLGYKG